MKTRQSSSSIDSRLLTVPVNDVDKTIRSMVAMPSRRPGLDLASHVPHDGTRVHASLKPTVGTVITTSPDLRIDHLDYLEYRSFFTRFASVSSYDVACSCSASFQLLTRLLDLRSVMRFFLSFPPAVGCALFSPTVGYALFLWLTSTIHLVDLRPAPAPGRSP